MGKRIEDLKLDNTPIEHTETASEDDRTQPWYQFIAAIDDLLVTGHYDWAFDTLQGMRETVESTRRVTEGQQRVLTNIENRGEEKFRRPSRRYEGYGGGGR